MSEARLVVSVGTDVRELSDLVNARETTGWRGAGFRSGIPGAQLGVGVGPAARALVALLLSASAGPQRVFLLALGRFLCRIKLTPLPVQQSRTNAGHVAYGPRLVREVA